MAVHSKLRFRSAVQNRKAPRCAGGRPGTVPWLAPILEYLEGRICLSDAVGLSSSANPSLPGEVLTFGDMVIPLSPGPGPTGTVQYQVHGNDFGSPVSLTNGASTSGLEASLSVGQHTITAIYSGDSNYSGQTVTMTQTVEAPSQVKGQVYTVNSLDDSGKGSGTTGDLRYAITQANANPGSLIDFSVTGTIQLTQALPAISANTALNGPGPSLLTLQGGGPSSDFGVLTVNPYVTATISGLTITGGNNTSPRSTQGSGGLDNAGTLALTDCAITGNSVSSNSISGFAGGVYCSGPGASLTMTNCTVSGNSANGGTGGVAVVFDSANLSYCSFSGNSGESAGAITAFGSAPITVSDCSISQNLAPGGLGAVNSGGVKFTNCLFSGNTGWDDGAIWGPTTLVNCTLSGNTGGDGAAIFERDGYAATAIDCTFLDNSATNGGGAIDSGGAGPLTLTGCTFSGNSASERGGAIYCDGGEMTLTDCTFSGNSAKYWGGAIDVNGDEATLTDCTISGNTANEGGGLFDKSGVPIDLTSCTISQNAATYEGGGIMDDGTEELSGCTISGNTAPSGAGILIGSSLVVNYYTRSYYPAEAGLSDCTIAGNSATSYGGGILNQGTLTLTNSTLSGNTAKAGGGLDDLVHAVGSYTPILPNSAKLSYCSLTGNSASTYGGGIMNEGVLTLTNSTLSGNTAQNDGGGLANISLSFFYHEYGPPIAAATLTDSTLYGNTSLYGGAISNEAAKLALTNDTLTANRTTGTGPYAAALGSVTSIGDIILTNSLIAGNDKGASPSTTPGDVAGTIDSKSAYNLIGDGDLMKGISNGANGNQIGSASAGTVINADLGSLANNGGPTGTVALESGSPAIDAGSNALAVDPATQQSLVWDQRGSGYARIVSGTVDIGAFEYGAFLVIPTQLVATPAPPSSFPVTSDLSLTVTAEDNEGNTALAFDSPVTVAIASGPTGGTLSGTLTETAGYGVASFSGLTFNEPGSYTLAVSGGGLTGTIGTIQVTPGPAVQIVITTEPPAGVASGATFQLVVADEDSLGFVNTSYTGSATVALLYNPGDATLGGTLTVPFQSGMATFNDLTLDAVANGYLLQVTSGSLVPATANAVDVLEPASVVGVSGSGPYGGTATLTATMMQGSTPLAGESVAFTMSAGGNIINEGSATTNSSGVATLPGVSLAGLSAGTLTGAIGASFAGNSSFAPASGSGNLTVNPAQATLSFGTLVFTYDGSAQTTTVTTNPAGLTGVSVAYSQNNQTVAAPIEAGTYAVTASLNNPNYSAAPLDGTLTVKPAPLDRHRQRGEQDVRADPELRQR